LSTSDNLPVIEFAIDAALDRKGAFVDAMLRLAVAPAAAKGRIQEILDATVKHAEARSAAEEARAAADGRHTEADARLAEIERREKEFASWSDAEGKRLKQADADVRAGEAANTAREKALVRREADIDRKAAAHESAVANMRKAVAA